MDEIHYYLEKISHLTDVDMIEIKNGKIQFSILRSPYNPLTTSKELVNLLKEKAENQKKPVVYRDSFGVFFLCFKNDETFLYCGPVYLNSLNAAENVAYFKYYHMKAEMKYSAVTVPYFKLISMTKLIYKVISGVRIREEELVLENHLEELSVEEHRERQTFFSIQTEEQSEEPHHTYGEERMLLDCIRTGDAKGAIFHSNQLDSRLGNLSSREITHWRYSVIVAIALCTRAAIEGGLSPGRAYNRSDYYIQELDRATSIDQLIRWRNLAIGELAREVSEKQALKFHTSYVEQCKDYVDKHYREKIHLESVAEGIGVSPSYLSRIFHKEEGMRFQDYINKVRSERAANLLTYSNESISYISEYVNFSSQSHFSKVFKQYFGVTPKQYRDRNKPKEFVDK